jgi:uncharacterized protein YdaL
LIGLAATTAVFSRASAATAATSSPQAVTWGASGSATTLVLYDTTNTYGWLGELYAMGTGNLASHFGTVTAEPVVDYVPGQVNDYTATVYLGSTYNEPLPSSFLNDVLSTTRPVIWAGDNVWQLSGTAGSATDTAFEASYGWDPSTSYFDSADTVASVTYHGQQLTRSTNNGPVLAPHITTPPGVTVLAQANCTDSTGAPVACNSIAQSSGTSFPWAIRSGNLTYIGEIPLSYMTESDRYLAFSDLLFDALAPAAPPVHQALVRLEDVSPGIDPPQQLMAAADYLYSQHIPFSVGVIPEYLDPNGTYNSGTPVNENISQTSNATVKAFIAALQYMQARGGTIIEHGDTHQYSNVANPYDGVTGDDFEFYQSWCSTTFGGPPDPTSPCPNTDYVVQGGPLPNDSQAWAQSRVARGQSMFPPAGLPTPAIWETPHYAASAADYAGIDQVFPIRYERGKYFGGQLSGGSIDYTHEFEQFFPYVVHDVDGSTIIPENAGNYSPEASNNNPPRPPSLVIANAQAELAVRQGVASFFFHPYYSVSYLQQIVQGIQGLGYTFVSPQSLLGPGQNVSVPVTVTTTSLPAATAGQTYSATLTAADGTAPYAWSVTSGSLPAGLSLKASTGAITGTPTGPGTSTVTVTATDSTVTPAVGSSAGSTVLTPTPGQASETLTLTVNPNPFGIGTASLPAGAVNQPYAAALSVGGGTAPYTWSASGLPQGLTLNKSTGVISGTPGKTGTSTVKVQVSDSSQPTQTATATLVLTVNAQLVVTTSALPAGTVGQTYRAAMSATGGVAPYTWAVTTGKLPAGLTLDRSTGAITGTPTASTNSTVVITATDSSTPSPATVTKTFTLTVRPAPLLIVSASLPSGKVNQPYSTPVTAMGGTAPYVWSASKLPAGVAINTTTGVLSGKPTKAGTYNVLVTVRDAASPAQSSNASLVLLVSS